MLVYRVEKKGYGPYSSQKEGHGMTSDQIGINSSSNKRRPLPGTDGIRDYPAEWPHYKFGFHDTKRLRMWFTERDLMFLARSGFDVNVYFVPKPKITFGKRQLVFDGRAAKFIRKSRVLKKYV